MSNKSTDNDVERLRNAIHKTTEILGNDARTALAFHLKEKYGVDIEGNNITLEKLESALSDLFGLGALAIINAVKQHLDP